MLLDYDQFFRQLKESQLKYPDLNCKQLSLYAEWKTQYRKSET